MQVEKEGRLELIRSGGLGGAGEVTEGRGLDISDGKFGGAVQVEKEGRLELIRLGGLGGAGEVTEGGGSDIFEERFGGAV